MSHKPDMKMNTIFAALLTAGIVGMLAGFVSRKVITPEFPHEDAFAIEVVETAGAGGAAGPTGPEPILGLLATADLAKGEALHKQCSACHDFTKGGPDRVGPNLWGIIGAKKAHIPSFAYSDDMKNAGGTWSYDDLNHFLWKPKSLIAGTKMNYIGIKKPEDRAALIAWLRTQGDAPAALPSEGEIAAEAAAAAPATPAEGTEATVAPEGEAVPAAAPTVPAADAAKPATGVAKDAAHK